MMGARVRKAALTMHITASVGWLGAVAAYLALDVTVATSQEPGTLAAAWIAMGLVTAWAIVPLAYASLATGLLMALGTRWGLFRHYWVLISLVMTVLATLVLLSEARYIASAAAMAANAGTSDDELRALPSTLLHSIGGLVVLLAIQVLNVYKPRGLTKYGWRQQQEALQAR